MPPYFETMPITNFSTKAHLRSLPHLKSLFGLVGVNQYLKRNFKLEPFVLRAQITHLAMSASISSFRSTSYN
jgi:hypothetical protein